MTTSQPLEGRIALITGASRGIGYQAALAYAKAGAHVIALARTVGGLEELDDEIRQNGGSATLVPADLSDYDALDRLGASIYERWGKLDVLLGNAGVLGVMTPLAQLKPSVFEEVFAINVTANYRLIRSLDPLLQASDAGRAVFLSSGAAQANSPFAGAYSASKAALESLIATYAHENRITKVNANLIDPGTIRTKMRAQYAPGENPDTVTRPEDLAPQLIEMSLPSLEENGKLYHYVTKKWRDI